MAVNKEVGDAAGTLWCRLCENSAEPGAKGRHSLFRDKWGDIHSSLVAPSHC